MHPQIAEERQREMLADAERRRIARQLAKHARAPLSCTRSTASGGPGSTAS
jgi:hypothetical protein